jgi:hypothetical protein
VSLSKLSESAGIPSGVIVTSPKESLATETAGGSDEGWLSGGRLTCRDGSVDAVSAGASAGAAEEGSSDDVGRDDRRASLEESALKTGASATTAAGG